MGDLVDRLAASRAGCRLVNSRVPDRLIGLGGGNSVLERHLRTCLSCQAEAAHQGTLARAVHDLPEAQPGRAPWNLVDDVMEGIARREKAAQVRGKAITAAAFGLLSAGLGVLVWMLGRRRVAGQLTRSR